MGGKNVKKSFFICAALAAAIQGKPAIVHLQRQQAKIMGAPLIIKGMILPARINPLLAAKHHQIAIPLLLPIGL
jgi:hypothetical protein